jgi:tripartite-type tricarboxylate transporter receptor subunit TctC
VALMARQRSPSAPDLPTTAEMGFPDLHVEVWNGLLFPKGTPADVVERAHAALIKTLAEPEIRRRLEEIGAGVPDQAANTPDNFQQLIRSENVRWVPILSRNR